MERYKWDVEAMEEQIARLGRAYESLKEGKQFLERLKEETMESWESIAGEIYQGNLGVDMKNYEAVLKELEAQIGRLEYIVHACYRECEKEIRAELNGFVGSIRPL